jgi:membrane-bound metal-dependent hydrolase YbcI (DUF457 family)
VVLWFLGGSLVITWLVFRDPAIDYRVLMLGAVLPDLVDGLFGGARVLHSVVGSVVLLVVVMLATIGRRAARRRWIFLPIGTFLHLALDGAFTVTQVFWWPFTGWSFDGEPLPSVERGFSGLNLLLEAAGLVALVWFYRRFGLGDPVRRRQFVRTGRLDRTLA